MKFKIFAVILIIISIILLINHNPFIPVRMGVRYDEDLLSNGFQNLEEETRKEILASQLDATVIPDHPVKVTVDVKNLGQTFTLVEKRSEQVKVYKWLIIVLISFIGIMIFCHRPKEKSDSKE